MKIFFSLNHFLPDHVAGTEIYTFNLARSLQEAGAEVAVLIPFFDSIQNDTYNYEGIKVIRYAENSENNRQMIMGKQQPLGLSAYLQILKEERPSVVHFHEIAGGRGIGIYHVQAVKALEIKTVLTCHLSTYSCLTGNLVFKEERLCDGIIRVKECTACAYHARGIKGTKSLVLQAASKLLYASGMNTGNWNSSLGTALGFPFLVEQKKKDLLYQFMLMDKIVVLTRWYQQILQANGVDAGRLFYCAQGLTGDSIFPVQRKSSLPIRLVFIGRVSKYKGLHLLLQALQQIKEEKICLDIYGPVTEEDYAKECLALAKGMSNVKWKGTIASDKVIAMLGQYDVLCLPSTFSEMSPLVIPEAFAAGIPVLASNVYGNAEQVQDGLNGWLFEFKNVSSLKNKLERLIEEPGLIDEARKHIPATKSFDTVTKEHLVMYKGLIG
jgi:glycosyltransferase involved in cell wall biosynthesis